MTQITTSVHKDLTRMSLVTESLSNTPRFAKDTSDQYVCPVSHGFIN